MITTEVTTEDKVVELPLVGGYKAEGEEAPPVSFGFLEAITQSPFLLFLVLAVICALMAAIPELRVVLMDFR